MKARFFRFKLSDGGIRLCVAGSIRKAIEHLSDDDQANIVSLVIRPVTLCKIEKEGL